MPIATKKQIPKDADGEPILTQAQLCLEVGFSDFYIRAARRYGYNFAYGRKTTKRHFLAWLKEHPEFRCTKLEGSAAQSGNSSGRPASTAGKRGESPANYD